MRRESHVRSCESGRGRFPPATHQQCTLGSVRGAARKGGPYRNSGLARAHREGFEGVIEPAGRGGADNRYETTDTIGERVH